MPDAKSFEDKLITFKKYSQNLSTQVDIIYEIAEIYNEFVVDGGRVIWEGEASVAVDFSLQYNPMFVFGSGHGICLTIL